MAELTKCCVIPEDEWDPAVCEHEGHWTIEYGGTCDCTDCRFFQEDTDES